MQAETTAANVRVAERDQTFAAGSRATGNGTDPAFSPSLTRRSFAPNFPLPVPSTTRAAPAWFGARYGWRRVRVKLGETAGSAPFHTCSNALASRLGSTVLPVVYAPAHTFRLSGGLRGLAEGCFSAVTVPWSRPACSQPCRWWTMPASRPAAPTTARLTVGEAPRALRGCVVCPAPRGLSEYTSARAEATSTGKSGPVWPAAA